MPDRSNNATPLLSLLPKYEEDAGSFYLSLENRAFDEADRKLGWLKECLGEDDPSVYRAGRALKKIRFGL